MATVQKITLSASRDIPFNKLVLSQANVRRIKAGVSIEELAEDIARRTLLQSLSVRPGAATPMARRPACSRSRPAGGASARSNCWSSRSAWPRPSPCPAWCATGGLAEEDSLAENVQRVALHPLDQFRAFQTLREKGLGEEDIAARSSSSPASSSSA